MKVFKKTASFLTALAAAFTMSLSPVSTYAQTEESISVSETEAVETVDFSDYNLNDYETLNALRKEYGHIAVSGDECLIFLMFLL